MKIRDFVIKNFELLETLFLLLFLVSIFLLLKEIQYAKYVVLSSSFLLVLIYWFKVTEKSDFNNKISLISHKLLWLSYLFLPISFYFKISLDKNANYLCIIILALSSTSLILLIFDFVKNKVKIKMSQIVRLVISIITTVLIFSLPLPKNTL